MLNKAKYFVLFFLKHFLIFNTLHFQIRPSKNIKYRLRTGRKKEEEEEE